MRRVGRREMEVLFSPDEAEYGGRWPVAPKYRVFVGVIYPYVDLDDSSSHKTFGSVPLWMPMTTPLAEGDAFLSFARLAARGVPPSKDAILDWVHQYGLLRLLVPDLSPEATVQLEPQEHGRKVLNQEPMSIEDFWEEARYAYDLLNLFEAIRSDDVSALRNRIVYSHNRAAQTRVAEILIDGEPASYVIVGESELSDDDVLSWCRLALQESIHGEIEGFKPVFTPESNIALQCPDLRTALYWQCACLVQGKRPIVTCKGCNSPLVQRRSNHWYHNSTCRSRRSRRDK
jgi:hypothetical protein